MYSECQISGSPEVLMAITDVVQNASSEEDGLLLNKAPHVQLDMASWTSNLGIVASKLHLRTIPMKIQSGNVMPIEQYTTTCSGLRSEM